MGVWGWIVLALLFVASGIASGSETAVVRANVPRLRTKARRGNMRAKRLIVLLTHHQEKILGAILLANNFFNVALSSLATALFLPFVTGQELVVLMLVVTLFLVVIGEIVPKTIALRYADDIAQWVAPVAYVLSRCLAPFFTFIQHINKSLVAAQPTPEETLTQHRETLEGAIDMHAAESGDFHERSVLRSVLDIADVELGEAATHRRDAFTVNLNDPNPLDRLIASPYRHVPIIEGSAENIIGVIDRLDLLHHLYNTKKDHTKKDNTKKTKPGGELTQSDRKLIFSKIQQPWFVPNSGSAFAQLRRFRSSGQYFAIVVDEYGTFEGIITIHDILDEIFGERTAATSDSPSTDNGKTDHDRMRGVKKEPSGDYLIDGNISLRMLNRELQWNIEDDDTHTIAGYVIQLARRIPQEGETFTGDGFRFEVIALQRNRIARVRVTPLEKQPSVQADPTLP